MKNLRIIDAHTHIGYWPKLWKTKSCLLKSMKQHGIKHAVFSFDASEFANEDENNTFLYNNPVLHMKQLEIAELAVKFCKKHKKKLSMLIWIKPYNEHNIEELQQFYDKYKPYIKGLKFHPCLSHITANDNRMNAYYKFAKKNHLPILVHTADDKYSNVKHLATAARKFPQVKFIAAHLQLSGDNTEALKVISKLRNVYGDTAWVSPEIILKCKEIGILNKLMFGSDTPVDGLKTYDHKCYKALLNNEIGLTQEEWDNLMFNTAKKIFNLDEII